jgi:16S rRNA A1518/A1519 N6-dimethyltransferase RsmA/KsgA/DIM1 with predicted DNA glycosylase/AP lyase activity
VFLLARTASAEPPATKPPPSVESAVVRVEAYEHKSLGAVVGAGRSVLVPFAAIEVDRS